MSRAIKLTQGKTAIVDDDQYEYLSSMKWQAYRRTSNLFYARRGVKVDGKVKLIYLHRFIMDAPEGMEVDHINGNGLDNRRANLRICTHAENNQFSWERRR